MRYTVTNPIEGQYFFACVCTCSGRSHPLASSMMRTTAARDCVSRYPALFKSDSICLDDFVFVIMKIIFNNEFIRMATGGQERSGWRMGCAGHLELLKSERMTTRHPVSPGEDSVRPTNPSRGKDTPTKASKTGLFAYLMYRLWKPNTVRVSVME